MLCDEWTSNESQGNPLRRPQGSREDGEEAAYGMPGVGSI